MVFICFILEILTYFTNLRVNGPSLSTADAAIKTLIHLVEVSKGKIEIFPLQHVLENCALSLLLTPLLFLSFLKKF